MRGYGRFQCQVFPHDKNTQLFERGQTERVGGDAAAAAASRVSILTDDDELFIRGYFLANYPFPPVIY